MTRRRWRSEGWPGNSTDGDMRARRLTRRGDLTNLPLKKLLKKMSKCQKMSSFLYKLSLAETSPLLYLRRPLSAKNRLLRTHLARNWAAPEARRRRSGTRGDKNSLNEKKNFHASASFLKSTKKLTALSGRWEFLFPVCDPAERRGCVVTAVRQSGFI